MKPSELRKIGKAKWGRNWMTPLAIYLGKHRITVWRLSTGRNKIKATDADKVRSLRA